MEKTVAILVLLGLAAPAFAGADGASEANRTGETERTPAMAVETSTSSLRPFGEFYGEATAARGDSGAYSAYRMGMADSRGFEYYGAIRGVAGSGNYLFGGAGADYVGLLPGIRLRAQIGARNDPSLGSKPSPDAQLGAVAYREAQTGVFFHEIYGEALWNHAISDFLPLATVRSGIALARGKIARGLAGAISPLATTKVSVDSAGNDSFRYAELQPGVRFSLIGSEGLNAGVTPGYAFGTGFHGPNAGYGELRVFSSIYYSF